MDCLGAFHLYGWTPLFKFQEADFNPNVCHPKIETGASGNKCSTGFLCPYAGLWSFLAADGVTSPLVMTKRTSNVSMQTHNLCCTNNTQISLGLRNLYVFQQHAVDN